MRGRATGRAIVADGLQREGDMLQTAAGKLI